MTPETYKIIEHINTGPRVQFQLHFINKMLIEILGEQEFEKINVDEKREALRELMDDSESGFNFGQKVADIIDNPENVDIIKDIKNKYIEQKRYEYIKNQYKKVFESKPVFKLYKEALELLKKSVLVHH